ncbi:MAG: hypothetical protein WC744_02240 [Patescibacteria group bacterium]|jgi:hypothetical protein
MKKDRFFWYFLIPWLLIITLFISLSPWLAELFATPSGQVFTGINRWSTDYYIYLSYIEQGVRGFLTTKLIFTIQPHSAVFFFLAYTVPGYIFGHILGLSSIFIYHFFRALYGLIFLSATIIFFYKLSKSKIVTLIAFFLTFYVSGFVKIVGGTRYLDWLQEQNIIGRATGPLHYSVGFIIFITAFIFYFYIKTSSVKKTVIFGLLLNGLLLSNPFNFLLMALCFAAYLPIKFLFNKKDVRFLHEFMTVFGAFLISVPLFLLLNYYLSAPPWGVVGVSPKFYVRTTPPVSLLEIAMSVGPIFFLGIFGAIRLLVGQPRKQMNVIIFLIIWPIIQFILLMFGDVFKIHPARAFSGLYYLPLAYFSASFIIFLSKKIKTSMYRYIAGLIIIILLLITLPNYYLSFKEQLFAFTDFKYFSPFIYPSKNQVQAFRFLEKNTPPYSNVLALFEAGTLINGFSGNSTEVSATQDFKTPFYANKLNNDEVIKLLKKYHYKYVYFGYQEKFVGGDMNKYPFLKKIFENKEVSIFKINLY